MRGGAEGPTDEKTNNNDLEKIISGNESRDNDYRYIIGQGGSFFVKLHDETIDLLADMICAVFDKNSEDPHWDYYCIIRGHNINRNIRFRFSKVKSERVTSRGLFTRDPHNTMDDYDARRRAHARMLKIIRESSRNGVRLTEYTIIPNVYQDINSEGSNVVFYSLKDRAEWMETIMNRSAFYDTHSSVPHLM
tara:strand:+ start:1130 stop:1705 length:576 start_codon:yes stop_codon:yes gene_type:complete